MDEKKLRQAISQKKLELNQREAEASEDVCPEDVLAVQSFYVGAKNTLAWLVEQLNSVEAAPLIEVGDHDIRKNRKSPKRAKV